jgi:hypothetical protein
VVGVTITAVRSFAPMIDLAGRDPALDVGTIVRGRDGGAIGRLATDDCDGNAATGEANGGEQGVEPLLELALDVGGVLELAYAPGTAPTRTWTSFPTPPTADEQAADLAEVTDTFFPDGATGCSAPAMTYFDSDDVFHCDEAQSVRELLLRDAGHRAAVKRAWASWTARNLDASASESDSFLARMFAEASGSDAEGWLKLGAYDWYTLTGSVHAGVLSTPGGIPSRFEAWSADAGCPNPLQPDEAFDDAPFP